MKTVFLTVSVGQSFLIQELPIDGVNPWLLQRGYDPGFTWTEVHGIQYFTRGDVIYNNHNRGGCITYHGG